MAASLSVSYFDPIEPNHRVAISALLQAAGITETPLSPQAEGYALIVLSKFDVAALEHVHHVSRGATVLAIALGVKGIEADETWALLRAGAADVLVWREIPAQADQIVARLTRWRAVREIVDCPRVRDALVGRSAAWRALMCQVVEVAHFTDASVLIMGESGTGKELIARLIHDLDARPGKQDLVVVDCTTITPELSGSEFFGHERGAFTGAMNARDGAFAVANHGSLFLDEIGELPPPLQAQLLRVIQEHAYKRVGSNVWQHTEFRLICATNRALETEVTNGRFRGDLYYRIAGWVCRTPPLCARREDILPLAQYFLAEPDPTTPPPSIDEPVRQYLLAREYPGNVRDLRRVVTRLHHRHTGPGPITIGDIPEDERPSEGPSTNGWLDGGFESAVHHAIELGVGLKEIAQMAAETAIRLALEQEDGNLHRAACRLGVTDRALQMRRANHRQNH